MSRFILLFLSLLLLYHCSTIHAADNNKIKKDKVIKGECLAVDEDYTEYVCLTLKQQDYTCDNFHPECSKWASQGECTKNPQFMLLDCRQACHSCISLHHGKAQTSTAAKRESVLHKLMGSQRYLHHLCDTTTVEHLKTCKNKHAMCTEWSVNGECSENPTYMKSGCPLACEMCN